VSVCARTVMGIALLSLATTTTTTAAAASAAGWLGTAAGAIPWLRGRRCVVLRVAGVSGAGHRGHPTAATGTAALLALYVVWQVCCVASQIVKNYHNKSTTGLSYVLVGAWVVGDVFKVWCDTVRALPRAVVGRGQ
jgi:hypothetical protein